MKDLKELRELIPNPEKGLYSADHVSVGIPIPKTRRVEQFSPEEWEEFTEEWASSLKTSYVRVARFAGSGDKGLDVVGFITDGTFNGGWHNYQCKHYAKSLAPNDIWMEIGKIIYYSFTGEYPPPEKYYFVAPKGVGTMLGKLLADPEKLKNKARENWPKYCDTIVENVDSGLEGDLLNYFEKFNFSIFSSKSLVELIEGHSTTTFHSVRFGGGLPVRPTPDVPPDEIATIESRYITQLYEAYSDHTGEEINDERSMEKRLELKRDFLRQRERFYHAESLRNFARDTVPPGTFDDLQEDIFQGVIDVYETDHDDGFARMKATVSQSARLSVISSPLSTATKVQDKQGVCHQLANENRLIWVHNND